MTQQIATSGELQPFNVGRDKFLVVKGPSGGQGKVESLGGLSAERKLPNQAQVAANENPMLAMQNVTAGTAGFGRDATPVSTNLTRFKELDTEIKSGSFFDQPDVSPISLDTNLAFNPLVKRPPTQEEVFKEHALHRLAAMDMPNYLEAPEGEFEKWAEDYKDASLNVIEEMISNRMTKPELRYKIRPDGTQSMETEIVYVRDDGVPIKRLPLSKEDIVAIGSETGMKSKSIYEYQLGEMTKNIMQKNRELGEFEIEMKALGFEDSPAFKEVYDSQIKLLNDMVDRYEATHKEYENYLTERGIK